MTTISTVGSREGCLLVQFPPSVSISAYSQVQGLLEKISQYNEHAWKICIEFRHASWYCERAFRMLDRYNSAIVFHDKNKLGFNTDETNASFFYLRFHGPDGNYRGTYSTQILEEFGCYIYDWLKSGKEVYLYFNNTIGAAIANLQYLRNFIKGLLS